MPMRIAILEDHEDRRAIMQSCLADRFFMYETRFFDDPTAMIQFLQKNLDQTLLVGLDHDLELKPGPAGQWTDPGTGREVANYLAQRQPVCPVVIHSSNAQAVLGMEMVLQASGWKTWRVVPFEDMDWIAKEWFRTIRRAILDTTRPATPRVANQEAR
jgi:hypothetical protein